MQHAVLHCRAGTVAEEVLIVPPSFVYILANRPRGVMYVGSTSSVLRRLSQHKSKAVDGFTSKYGVTRLVHLEEYPSISEARAREYSLKRWRRAWKFTLIEEVNPEWRDLWADLPL
jgi:putative endonuclease